MQDLKKYDKFLDVKKNLDGSVEIYRTSPFNSQKTFSVITLRNQYLGSWIKNKLMSMDCQRRDLFSKSIKNNMAIRNSRDDNRVSAEIAEFFEAGGERIVV